MSKKTHKMRFYLTNKLLDYFQNRRSKRSQPRYLLLFTAVLLTILLPVVYFTLINPLFSEAAWYSTGGTWEFRRKITVHHEQVSGSTNLTNFPMVVTLQQDSQLANHAQSDGDDILFTNAAGTKLDHEIETYNSTTGALVAWIEVDTLDYDDDTVIFMYYGEPDVSSQQNASGVWTGYEAVWHLDETTTDESTDSDVHLDSSGNVVAMDNINADDVTAKIGTGQAIDNSGDYIETAADDDDLDVGASDDLVISAWVYRTDTTSTDTIIAKKTSSADTAAGWMAQVASADNQARLYVADGTTSEQFAMDTQTTIPSGQWTYLVFVWDEDSAANTEIYLNGVDEDAIDVGAAQSAVDSAANALDINIGSESDNNLEWNGNLDEVRVYKTIPTPDWIATEYNNQNDPAAFYTMGGTEVEDGNNPPIAEWKFDEGVDNTCPGGTNDACDSSANGNDLAKTNASWAQTAQCISGNCLSFDGSGDYLTRADDAEFDFVAADDFSIAGWFRRGPISTNPDYIVAKHGTSGSDGGYKVYMDSDGDLYCGIDDDDTWGPDAAANTTNANYDDNQWHHFECVKDGTTSLTLYVDGKRVNQNSSIGGVGSLANTDAIYVGIDGDGTSNSWEGFLDEVKIYDYARTANQVTTDAIAGAGSRGSSMVLGVESNDYLTKGLVGYWSFAELSGTSVADTSGSNLTGTLTNAQETGTATSDANTTTTVLRDNGGGGLSATNDVYIGMILYITDDAGCSLSANEERFITDYDGTNKDITVAPAFSADLDGCDYTIRHQTRGRFGRGMAFDDENAFVDIGTGPSAVQSVAFWVKPTATTEYLLDLNGSSYISASSGTLSATGFTSPEIYVNGNVSTTLTAGVWQHVAVTTTSNLNATDLDIGRIEGSGYLLGQIDEVRVYDRELSPTEVEQLFRWYEAPIVHFKFDENTGTSTAYDSSGFGHNATLTGVVSTDWVPGKFGSALQLDGNNNLANFYSSSMNDQFFGTQGTAMFWVEIHTYDTTLRRLLEVGTTGTSNRILLYQSGSGGDSTITMQYIANGTAESGAITIPGGTSDWIHLAMAWDKPNDIVQFYVNGSYLSDSGSLGDYSGVLDSGRVRVGLGSTSPYANMDEVKMFNYPLTGRQILKEMNAGNPTGPNTPTAHYRLDSGQGQSAYDSSNNTYGTYTMQLGSTSGSDTNDPTWLPTASCVLGKCLEFDGSDNYLIITDSDNHFDLYESQQLTLSGWFYRDTSTTDDAIFAKNNVIDNSGFAGWGLYIDDSTDQLTFTINDASADQYTMESTTTFTSTGWNHFVLTWNRRYEELNKIYINGENDSASLTGTLSSISNIINSDSVTIGAEEDAGMPFDGRLDEIKMYSGLFSSQDVLEDYNLGAITFGVGQNQADDLSSGAGDPPVLYWDFNENTGTGAVLLDRSGNSYTGTLDATMDEADWVPGFYGSALHFDGTNDWISSSAEFYNANYTVGAWVWRDAASPSDTNYRGVVSKWSSGVGNEDEWFLGFRNNNVSCWQNTSADFADLDTSVTFPEDVWSYVAISYDGTNFNCYLNGRLIAQEAAADVTNGTLNIHVASNSDAANTYLHGKVDEVKVWDYGLSQDQLIYEYSQGAPFAHYQLDECTGSTANNSARLNPYPGTITITASGDYTSTGNCSSGTSTEAWNAGTNGKYESGLGLDGTNDFITISDNAGLRFDLAYEDFSVFAWIKRDATGEMNILSKEDADNDGWRLQMTSGDAVLCSVDAVDITSSATITDTNWHHVGCTIDRSGNGQVYIDGVANGSATAISSEVMGNTASLLVGTRSYSATSYFNGLIDDIRLYRYALSAAQVRKVFNQNAIRFGPEEGVP